MEGGGRIDAGRGRQRGAMDEESKERRRGEEEKEETEDGVSESE